jgi:hypothetical protein
MYSEMRGTDGTSDARCALFTMKPLRRPPPTW